MQEVQRNLPIGSTIQNRYIVENLLGKGGFGAVYLVRDSRVKGNLFALKEIVDTDKKERERFRFECEVLNTRCHFYRTSNYTHATSRDSCCANCYADKISHTYANTYR